MNSSPTTMLVNQGSLAAMMSTKRIEQVINILLKENESLKDQRSIKA